MKRTEMKRGKGLARGESTLARTRLAQRSEKRKAAVADPEIEVARLAWHQATILDRACACGCGRAGNMHGHHVVSRQHVRKHGGDEWDLRNRLSLAPECHANHHTRTRKIPQSVLLPGNLAFARELLGEAAADYLDRLYPKHPAGE